MKNGLKSIWMKAMDIFINLFIRKKIIFSLGIIFLMILIVSFFVIHSLTVQKYDSVRINLSGRQRMLSQKMTEELLLYNFGRFNKDAVLSTVKVFNTTLIALKDGGDAPLDLSMTEFKTIPEMENKETKDQLEKVMSLWIVFKQKIESVLENNDDSSMNYIIDNNTKLLDEMDIAVVMIKHNAEKKITRFYLIIVLGILAALSISIIFARKETLAKKKMEQMVEERTRKLNRALYDTEASRDKIDGILKSVSDGLIVTDIYNRITLMNRVAEDLLSVRFSEVINRPIDFAIEERTLREKLIDTFNKKKTDYQFDFQLPGDDPEYPRFMRARTSVIHDREGKDTGIVTIFHDVTHEREVDRMKTEFISTAAHELRTPLTSIQGFSEILQKREDISEEEKKRFLSYINKQAVNLAEIINDLLDISRIESGREYTINKVICDAGEAIKNIIPYFQETSSKHKFDVVLPDKPVKCYVDKEKIEQALKNILSNAVKYSPEGGVIRVIVEVLEDYCQVSVEDQGMGMTLEQVEKVFDKFYRADASNTAISGTGLGMSIVKYLIEAHGGKVFVESEPGKGTTVRFTIPLDNNKKNKN